MHDLHKISLDDAPLAILWVGTDRKIRYANYKALDLLERRQEEISTISIDQVDKSFPRYEEWTSDGAVPAAEKPVVYETNIHARHSNTTPVEVNVHYLRNGSSPYAVAYIKNISEKKISQQRYERQVKKIASLHAIDIAITASFDLRVTLDVILDHILSQLSLDAADILIFDQHIQRLEFGACRGFKTDALKYTNLPLGKSYAGQAALERRIIEVNDLKNDGAAFSSSPFLKQESFAMYFGIPLIAKGQVKGVLELFHREYVQPDKEWFEFAQALSQQAAIAIDNASLLNDLQRTNVELTRAYDTTLEGWSKALDLRDQETEGHCRRVTELSIRVARAIGLSSNEILQMRRGALLHDIGKMGIPDSVLLKPGPLTDEEWKIMKLHPDYAYQLLAPIAFLRSAIEIPYHHHERWDGTGYPLGLKGERIPAAARIFAIADVWDAVTSERPYRSAWPEERALDFIHSESDRHFDPAIEKQFRDMIKAYH